MIYLSGGMSLDQTKLAAPQFKSDHTELGSRRSQDDLAIFKAMLKELPPALLFCSSRTRRSCATCCGRCAPLELHAAAVAS